MRRIVPVENALSYALGGFLLVVAWRAPKIFPAAMAAFGRAFRFRR